MPEKHLTDHLGLSLQKTVTNLPQINEFRLRGEKHTLSLRLDGILNRMVNKIAKVTNVRSSQQAIRESIVIYDLLLSQAEQGKDIRIHDPETGQFISLFERSDDQEEIVEILSA